MTRIGRSLANHARALLLVGGGACVSPHEPSANNLDASSNEPDANAPPESGLLDASMDAGLAFTPDLDAATGPYDSAQLCPSEGGACPTYLPTGFPFWTILPDEQSPDWMSGANTVTLDGTRDVRLKSFEDASVWETEIPVSSNSAPAVLTFSADAPVRVGALSQSVRSDWYADYFDCRHSYDEMEADRQFMAVLRDQDGGLLAARGHAPLREDGTLHLLGAGLPELELRWLDLPCSCDTFPGGRLAGLQVRSTEQLVFAAPGRRAALRSGGHVFIVITSGAWGPTGGPGTCGSAFWSMLRSDLLL